MPGIRQSRTSAAAAPRPRPRGRFLAIPGVVLVLRSRERQFPYLHALLSTGLYVSERPAEDVSSELLETVQPDVVVLVISRCDAKAVDILSKLGAGSGPFVVVVTEGVESFEAFLQAGADSCFAASMPSRVLVAQLEAFIRRRRQTRTAVPQGVVRVGDLTINFDRRAAKVGDTNLQLSPTELRILGFLAQHAGSVCSPDEILEAAGADPRAESAAQYLKVFISRIRQKLQASHLESIAIVSVRGMGYMLEQTDVD